MRSQYPFYIGIISATLLATGCFRTSIPVPRPPTAPPGQSSAAISGISPTEGPLGTQVTITGTGFSIQPTADTVYFNGKQATVTSATATQLVVTVPAQAGSGIVTVTANGTSVTGPMFTYDYQYMVTTLAGGSTNMVDGTGANAGFGVLNGITNDRNGNLYLGDETLGTIRKITTDKGVVTTISGTGMVLADVDGTLSTAAFATPADMVVSGSTLYVLDAGSGTRGAAVRMISGNNVSTIAGGGPGGRANGTGTAASFGNAWGIAMDAAGNFYVADATNNLIRKVTSAGVVTTFAGNGGVGYLDATGTNAMFHGPSDVAIDKAGNIFVADEGNQMIRKITPAGVVSTFAGSGSIGSADGKGTAASFYDPSGLSFDNDGNLLVADMMNNIIRKIAPDGTVTTIAGTGVVGQTDGPGKTAQFGAPSDLTVDANGVIYVADGYSTIRKIAVQ
jgi:sugar lactone lactonase YvrE